VDNARLHALLDVNRSLMAELDADVLLRHLLEVAREHTGAAYAAIGVLGVDRERLERFVTAGIDAAGRDPGSYGFPAGPPAVGSFLGVPITVRGEVWGNLYLTEKAGGGPFSADDEEVAFALATSAAVAIGNARLYHDERARRSELERANHVLETTTELSRALGGVTDVDRTLELISERLRTLLSARAVELAVLDGDAFIVRAAAGVRAGDIVGSRIPVEQSLARTAFRTGRTQRFEDVPAGSFAREHLQARTAITTPLIFKGRPLGVLVVLDRVDSPAPFGADDIRVLEAFAASAATALATAQSATEEALRRSIDASEHERRRWARELHDETLQEFAGLRVLLAGARRAGDPGQLTAAVDEAMDMIAMGVANLRALITDLRPASLDDLGIHAALEALVGRVRVTSGLDIELAIDLAFERGEVPGRLDAEVETTIYRLVQEALTNIAKHAQADHVEVRVTEASGVVDVRVCDDGAGFDAQATASGFGLLGIRERLAVVRGSVRIDTSPQAGTTVHARIPVLTRTTRPPVHASS
jgi:signal transduction histidine kinase